MVASIARERRRDKPRRVFATLCLFDPADIRLRFSRVGSENLHERFEDLTEESRDLHRAIISLMEELEAIDWYQQRVDATKDEELKAVLGHNRDEEIEHAMMNLEWIRRRNATVDDAMRTYLFTDGPITEVEEAKKAAEVSAAGGAVTESSVAPAPRSDGSLGIGSLKLA
jgi:ferritin-like protein